MKSVDIPKEKEFGWRSIYQEKGWPLLATEGVSTELTCETDTKTRARRLSEELGFRVGSVNSVYADQGGSQGGIACERAGTWIR
jgi:hypothetical protein